MHSLLIVEDNDDLRENMRWALMSQFTVFEASSFSSCMATYSQEHPDVVCLDMGLDNVSDKGLEAIDAILTMNRTAKVVVITANTSTALGPEAVRRGAFDFFDKPVDINLLKQTLNRALRISSLEQSTSEEQTSPSMQIDTTLFMLGRSEPMKQVFSIIKKLSQTNVNVLISGESGTGKELCARAIHYHSARRNNSFVPINCGAIPENLIESELFGYVKGAFTGANADKQGLITSAEGGTLLLDEIGEMPKNMQVKLLRFLEDQQVQPVGGITYNAVDVRIIAATNRKNFENEQSTLRSDLYYRLSEFQIDLPPLRERGEDILHIARAIIEKNRIKFGCSRLHLNPRSEQALINYSWPGNVRELENKLSRASITCTNECIEPIDLQLTAQQEYNAFTYKDARDVFDREYILQLLRKHDFNISETAKTAALSRPTLYSMMKKCKITLETEKRIN